ncbi:MAG: MBL fold metallo-hydrolase [Verrucomicrobia bacterium]|nr:MBL fold metallo-hydrolase [Verrucomicrobiota bacterium]
MKVHTIDLKFQNVEGVIAAFLIESDGELALIESGPGSTLEALRAGIEELGFSVTDVNKVLVTHIHLDHAGGAGWFASQGATIYVHRKGARHLIDPSRLLESARMVYGDRMDELWGEMLAVPAEQVVILEDGDEVRVGASVLVARDTPGHARHHHAFVCGEVVFVGDVAGVRLAGQSYISVASAPPQFDAEAYEESINKLLDGKYTSLYLTHFGEVSDVSAHLEHYQEAVKAAWNFVSDRLEEGIDADSLHIVYEAFQMERAFQAGVPPEIWSRYQLANPASMCADGLRIYHEKRETL